MDINAIELYGKIILCENAYTIHDKSYVKYIVAIHRRSGKADVLPVTFGAHLLQDFDFVPGDYIKLDGCLRSRNYYEGGKRALQGFVHALSVSKVTEEEYDEATNRNMAHLQGFVCLPVAQRLTRCKGRNIADVMIASTRQGCQSNYISCVLWGEQALEASTYQMGDKLDVRGRYQSRLYIRKVDNNIVERVIYELHISEVIKLQNAIASVTA